MMPILSTSLIVPPPTTSNNQIILGADNVNVPRILAIIADVCEKGALEEDEQVLMRLLSIARHVQVSGHRTLFGLLLCVRVMKYAVSAFPSSSPIPFHSAQLT